MNPKSAVRKFKTSPNQSGGEGTTKHLEISVQVKVGGERRDMRILKNESSEISVAQ